MKPWPRSRGTRRSCPTFMATPRAFATRACATQSVSGRWATRNVTGEAIDVLFRPADDAAYSPTELKSHKPGLPLATLILPILVPGLLSPLLLFSFLWLFVPFRGHSFFCFLVALSSAA